MFQYEIKKRVRYSETDKMGFLYYGHYAKYYEIGRVESLRSLGLSYKKMEDDHRIMVPVINMESRFIMPAYYDEHITIRSILREMPGKMMTFYHELLNEEKKLINTAKVKLFFVNMDKGNRINAPKYLCDKLKPYFS